MGDFLPQFIGVQISKIFETTSQPIYTVSGWNEPLIPSPLINPLPTEHPSTRSSSVGTLLVAAQDTSKSPSPICLSKQAATKNTGHTTLRKCLAFSHTISLSVTRCLHVGLRFWVNLPKSCQSILIFFLPPTKNCICIYIYMYNMCIYIYTHNSHPFNRDTSSNAGTSISLCHIIFGTHQFYL